MEERRLDESMCWSTIALFQGISEPSFLGSSETVGGNYVGHGLA